MSNRQTLVYDTLCDIYGTDAVDFFTNALGMQILENDDIYQELIDIGALEEEDDADEEEEYENPLDYEDLM